MELLKHYAAHGFKCFRLQHNSKLPATQHGFKDAQIIEDANHFEGYNIGIATGLTNSGKYLCVIDIDNKNGKNGSHDWSLIIPNIGLSCMLSTWEVETPNNGLHIYFLSDVPIPGMTIGVSKGIDIKCVGGYVVAPPSVLLEGKYQFKWPGPGDFTVMQMPKLLQNYLLEIKKPIDVEQKTDTTKEEIEWLQILEDCTAHLENLDPDCDRTEWIGYLIGFKTIKHKLAYERFMKWSQRSPKFNQKHFDRDWSSVSSDGAKTYKSIIHASIKRTNTATVILAQDNKLDIPRNIGLPKPEGLWGDMYEHYTKIYKGNEIYGYAGPVILLGYLFQRKFKLVTGAHSGLYHAVVGKPYSLKTSFLMLAVEFVLKLGLKPAKNVVSANGLLAMLANCPSLISFVDDGLDGYASELEDAKGNANIATKLDLLRTLYGGPRHISGTGNKKLEDQTSDLLEPRLTMLYTGTTSHIQRLLSLEKFRSDGSLSRFAIWQANSIDITYRDEINACKVMHWNDFDLVNKVKDVIGGSFESTSASTEPNFIHIEDPVEGTLVDKYCEEVTDKYIAMAKKEDDQQNGLYSRSKQRMLGYACIHAISCKRRKLNELDIFLADRLIEYHLDVYRNLNNTTEPDDLTLIRQDIIRVLRERAPLPRGDIYKYLKTRFRDQKYNTTKKSMIAEMISCKEIVYMPKSSNMVKLADQENKV